MSEKVKCVSTHYEGKRGECAENDVSEVKCVCLFETGVMGKHCMKNIIGLFKYVTRGRVSEGTRTRPFNELQNFI